MSDMGNYTKLSKEYKDLEKVVTAYDSYRLTLDNINSTKAILEKRERSGIPGDG
ncbi:Peptide chain release factor 1 [Cyclobacterium qasimii M12-11B]|uniref:Peptide chain release factor 1 n=1 Tax=Cyclobacterium qasimii M12-11B TaxID=641524 RepID=S7WSF9_9BACT|nr:Peptide chain release factor 1 [Cyclobacterium qasimii M12-11B]